MILNIISLPFVNKTLKKSPIILVDCGAAGGIDSMFKDITKLNETISYGFEASPREFLKLKNEKNIKYFSSAISSSSGIKDFYVHKTDGSLTLPKKFNKKKINKIKVKVKTIDDLVKNKTLLEAPNVIKTDLEGHDFYALYGAKKSIKNNTLAIKSEIFWDSKSKNGGFGKIHDFLIENDFVLFGITYEHSYLGNFTSADVLYLKSIDKIIVSKKSFEKKRSNILKLILLSVSLNLYEYAQVIILKAKKNKIISSVEFNKLRKIILKKNYLPNIFSKNSFFEKLSLIIFYISTIFAGENYRKKSIPKYNQIKRPNFLFKNILGHSRKQNHLISKFIKNDKK